LVKIEEYIMINIVVCEDNQEYQNLIVGYIEKNLKDFCIPGEIVLKTESPILALEAIEKYNANVFFLDINLNGTTSGYELAQEIKNKAYRSYIVFISEHLEYVFQSFKVRAFDFLPKPVTEGVLGKCICELFEDYKKIYGTEDSEALQIKSGMIQYNISKKEILYIEKHHNKAVIHTLNQSISCYETLEALETKLGDRDIFKRCHKSYIVNKKYIDEIRLSTMQILLKSGHVCYLSKSYKKNVIP
jgi:two-component system response regulator AgrA